MNLQEHLHDCAEANMQEYIENHMEGSELDGHYDNWSEFFTMSSLDWWRINLNSLSYSNFQELLKTNLDYCEETGNIHQPNDVECLMSKYGHYWINKKENYFMELFDKNIEMYLRQRTQA